MCFLVARCRQIDQRTIAPHQIGHTVAKLVHRPPGHQSLGIRELQHAHNRTECICIARIGASHTPDDRRSTCARSHLPGGMPGWIVIVASPTTEPCGIRGNSRRLVASPCQTHRIAELHQRNNSIDDQAPLQRVHAIRKAASHQHHQHVGIVDHYITHIRLIAGHCHTKHVEQRHHRH